MEITNCKIYDLEESIVASGLPMMADYDEKWIANEIENLATCEDITESPHFKRACKLAANPAGSGHNNFLSGVLVSFNVTATQVWWMQFERYHFAQIVSSQSKMHRLKQMIKSAVWDKFHEKVHEPPIEYLCEIFASDTVVYDDDDFVYNCPMGLELTARITTNYLQLKTIWNQRHNHRLEEWRKYCAFIESLPFAQEFIIGGK